MIKLKILAVAVLVFAVGAACGGDSGDATATTEAQSLTPQAINTDEMATATAAIPTSTPIPAPGVDVPTAVSFESDLGDIAYGYVETIVSEYGERNATTEQELAAAEFIAAELRSFGYEAEVRGFELRLISDDEPWLRVTGEEEQVIESLFMYRTGFGDVEGRLEHAGLGLEGDFPEEGLDGAVALIGRGETDFEVKAQNARAAGASAVIIYNNEPENFSGTLQSAGGIPALSISQEDGQALLAMMESGEVTVRVKVETEDRESRNVVATKKGSIPGAPTIVVGAHYDADTMSVGANDNASGTGTLLAVAQALKDDDLGVDVTFVAFGGEEVGFIGSQKYVTNVLNDDTASILGMINLDVVGSGERAIVAGEPVIQLEVLRLATELGVNVSPGNEPEGLLSDHVVFLTAGLPAVFFFGDDLSRINTVEDTLEFVDPALLGDVANLAAALVRSLAGS